VDDAPRVTHGLRAYDARARQLLGGTLTSLAAQRLLTTVHLQFLKATSTHNAKVFALKDVELSAGETLKITKQILFKPTTTHVLYPGEHFAEFVVNGQPKVGLLFHIHIKLADAMWVDKTPSQKVRWPMLDNINETEKSFAFGDYQIDILVTGFPGKSVCHGSLGFSTIVLIRWRDRVALLDVGSFGQRNLLQEKLDSHGLGPDDVTDILLTHSHYDHSINWVMFPRAKVVISEAELEWSLTQPWGRTVVPELYVRELAESPQLQAVQADGEVFPGIVAHTCPGHTPGSLVFVLSTDQREMIFTGDACKNRAELLSRSADMTFDAEVTQHSIEHIWSLWQRQANNILVPGHDVPMVLEDGAPRYLGQREAAIRTWYGDTLEQTTWFSLLS
jgi:N-acyl homoserine lactone hydrolase